MNFDPGPLFYKMADIFAKNYKPENKVIICNEGGSRSGKTWDTFHFLYAFCDHNRNKRNDIYILRDTLTACRDHTFKEFKDCMSIIGVSLDYMSEGQKPYVNVFGNNIYFRGLDDEKNTEGYPSDIIFINEALDVTSKSKISGLRMRCRKMMIFDWNPKFTQHWCFDMEHNENTFFTRSTYLNNKHLNKSVVSEIESYNPWEPDTYLVDGMEVYYKGKPVESSNTPPPNIRNIENKTADEWRWRVYGLGLRSAPEGVIFKYVDYVSSPPDLPCTYGLDFGFTADPTALVRHWEDAKNIWLEPLSYKPIDNPEDISSLFQAIGLQRKDIITADSADRYTSEKRGSVEMVTSLRHMGWNIHKVRKTKNIMFWLASMKTKKIHIVKNGLLDKARVEFENYRLKEINGIEINQPIDGFDHIISAARYSHMAHNSVKFELGFK